MNQIRGNYILINNELCLSSSLYSIDLTGEIRIYEVIRITSGISLFLEDHLERLYNSAKLAGLSIQTGRDQLINRLAGLIEINKFEEGNVRIEFIFKTTCQLLTAWFIPHSYPADEDYLKGVPLALFYGERENPNAKIVQSRLRSEVNDFISKSGIYEAILVNKEHYLTEGSRSNFFVIRNKKILTPPSGQVLEGITRKYVLNICSKNGIPCGEEQIHENDLEDCNAAFVTGTSPKILPASKIGIRDFNPKNPLLKELLGLYNEEIESYILLHR
jgi:branched-chain amino acid aminotransferase